MTLADLSAFLFPMRTHLLSQLAEQRADHLRELASKDAEIRQLRKQLGVRMEAPTEPRPKQVWTEPVPQGWDSELKMMLQEEEDGIRERGRVQEYEPSAHDGAQT